MQCADADVITYLGQVQAGTVDMSYIDETVKTVLRTKFSLGLFESKFRLWMMPHVDPILISYCSDPYPYDDYLSTLRTPETRALLHVMERETIVLLENRENTLPLSKSIRSVALIGPQVDRVSVSISVLIPTLPFSIPAEAMLWRLSR